LETLALLARIGCPGNRKYLQQTGVPAKYPANVQCCPGQCCAGCKSHLYPLTQITKKQNKILLKLTKSQSNFYISFRRPISWCPSVESCITQGCFATGPRGPDDVGVVPPSGSGVVSAVLSGDARALLCVVLGGHHHVHVLHSPVPRHRVPAQGCCLVSKYYLRALPPSQPQ
jgi:hypothetical protein